MLLKVTFVTRDVSFHYRGATLKTGSFVKGITQIVGLVYMRTMRSLIMNTFKQYSIDTQNNMQLLTIEFLNVM